MRDWDGGRETPVLAGRAPHGEVPGGGARGELLRRPESGRHCDACSEEEMGGLRGASGRGGLWAAVLR